MRDYGRDVLRLGRCYWSRCSVAAEVGSCLVLLCESLGCLVGLRQRELTAAIPFAMFKLHYR